MIEEIFFLGHLQEIMWWANNSFPTKKNNDVNKVLLQQRSLNATESKKRIIHNAMAAKIYSFPKLHKSDLTLGPLVPYI